MKAIALFGKRRVVWGLVTVIVVLVILSFVLPYVGSGHSGLTKVVP